MARDKDPGIATLTRALEARTVEAARDILYTREEGGSFKLIMVLTRGPKETDPQWKVVTELISRFLLRPTLLCPNGPAKPTGGGSDGSDSSIRFERSYPTLEADNQPTAVQVHLPGEFETVNVKFRFKDVAMP